MALDRRDVMVAGAAAAAAVGLGGRLAMFPSAAAEEAAVQGFHSFKVGDIEVTTVSDGRSERAHDAGFIRNATVEETKAALRAAGKDDSQIIIPYTVTFAKIGGKTIMFDSGTGGQLSPLAGRLSDNMRAAGIEPQSISTIVITHFHPDHIFGLMTKGTYAQVYPQAEIIVPEQEFKFWTGGMPQAKPEERFKSLEQRVEVTLAKWPNVRRVAVGDEREVVGGVRAIAAHGHTAGHTVYQLASGDQQLLVMGDITNIPALFARHPGWHCMFDWDAQQAEASRRRMFDRAVADKALMTGYHYGMPGAGRIEKDGEGYAFVPVG